MKSFINVGTIGALGRENDLVITPLSPRNHPLITPFGLDKVCIKSLCGMWKYVASLLIVLFVGVGNAWAERWVKSCNIKYYTNNGTSSHDGWYNEGDGINIKDNDVTLNFGTLTSFYLKEAWAKAEFSDDWGTNGNQMKYGFDGNESEYNLDWGWQTGDNPKHYGFPISEYNVISNAPNKPGENTMRIYFNLNYNADGSRQSKWLYINFTIPGFTTTSTSKSFGTTIPVNTESETTISFTHHGDAPTTGNCVITGTDASAFEVRSISNSGVNVVFKPTTTGSKTATLTINDTYGTSYSTLTITLTGTAVAKGETTRLYFNAYKYNDGAGDWAAANAKYRFTCAYTPGVYTRYNMTKCDNTDHTYYADVEIKEVTVSIDRYNPASPYVTWNTATPTSPNLSSTNPYAKSTSIDGAYASNHPYNDVGSRKIYYDNSDSKFTNTVCMLLGHDYDISNGSLNTFSKAYTLGLVDHTKLYYGEGSDTWHDATYYAVIDTDEDAATIAGWNSDNNWGSSTISGKGTKGYTTAYKNLYGLIGGNVYMTYADSYNNSSLTITQPASLNSDQTIKYSVSFDGSDTYSELSSGGNNTPAQIAISAYKFNSGTYDRVTNTSNSQTISAGQNSTVSAYVPAAYTGETSLSYTSVNSHFDWIGWYDAANGGSEVSTPYYPKSAGLVYARLKAKLYTVTYNANEGSVTPSSAQATAFTSVTLPTPERAGYNFTGWYHGEDKIGDAGASYTPAADIELTAHWTEATLAFKATTNSNWSTATNWTPNCVPTIDHDVVIEKPVIVDVTAARAKSVVLDQHSDNTGKITIDAGQELVIAGTLRKTTDGSNRLATAAEDVVINSDASNGLGALVMGTHEEESGLNQATVYFYSKSGKNASEKWVNQYVGTPFGNYPTAVSQFYNSWMYRIRDDEGVGNVSWLEVEPNEGLKPFKGYSVISNTNVGHTYEMQGSLVASANQSLTLYYFGEPTMNPNNETLLANSWMAPIKISKFTEDDFKGAEATIYIFNAGSLDDYKNAGDDPDDNKFVIGDGPGQYSEYPINNTEKVEDVVIPAMQSFSVFANSGATEMEGGVGKLALDFTRLVYNPAIANPDPTTPEPNRSPKRAKAETSEREEMLLCVRGANGPADRVRILVHKDFDERFENGWDGHKIFGESFTPQLYAMTTDGNMAVNCIPEYEGTVLGFKPSDVDNSYTFYFRYDGDETLYLNDLKTEQSSLIQDENTYPFTSSVEDAEARFVISATPIPHTPTGIQSVQSDGEQGSKARKLFINGAIYIIRSGRMYDVLGKTIRNEK